MCEDCFAEGKRYEDDENYIPGNCRIGGLQVILEPQPQILLTKLALTSEREFPLTNQSIHSFELDIPEGTLSYLLHMNEFIIEITYVLNRKKKRYLYTICFTRH